MSSYGGGDDNSDSVCFICCTACSIVYCCGILSTDKFATAIKWFFNTSHATSKLPWDLEAPLSLLLALSPVVADDDADADAADDDDVSEEEWTIISAINLDGSTYCKCIGRTV